MIAIYKAPGSAPKTIEIDNTLEALQAAVDGYIETVTLATDCVIICNEEGRLNDMPFNCEVCGCPFFGPLLIVGVKGDEFTDLYRPQSVARMLFGGLER